MKQIIAACPVNVNGRQISGSGNLVEFSCTMDSSKTPNPIQAGTGHELQVYVLRHCANCDHARTVAAAIELNYPDLRVTMSELDAVDAEIPETVFAAPTYLLDGRVWSLGNPSAEKIRDTFGPPVAG